MQHYQQIQATGNLKIFSHIIILSRQKNHNLVAQLKSNITMTSFAFNATCIATSHPDGECHLVGFADNKYDTELYLMLQRSFKDDEQDIKLGMNTYHVEWCSQINSGYGGIRKFVLKPTSAEVFFERPIANKPGSINQLSISFDFQTDEYEVLKIALSHIFAGSDCLEVSAIPSQTIHEDT